MDTGERFPCSWLLAMIVSGLITLITQSLPAQMLTYGFSGLITEVTTNENDVIPGLSAGDAFDGFVRFDANGWNQTAGTVFASFNEVDLLFDGEFIYGSASVDPSVHYSIRVAADAGGEIGVSSFSAFNFGPELEDTDGSAGHSDPFPSSLHLAEFETNRFRIAGTYVSTGDAVSATWPADRILESSRAGCRMAGSARFSYLSDQACRGQVKADSAGRRTPGNFGSG